MMMTTGQEFNKEYYTNFNAANNKKLRLTNDKGWHSGNKTTSKFNKFDYSPDTTKHGAFSFSPQARRGSSNKTKQTSFPQLYIDKDLNKKEYQSERMRTTTKLKNSFSLDKFHRGEELQRLFNGGDKDIDWWSK